MKAILGGLGVLAVLGGGTAAFIMTQQPEEPGPEESVTVEPTNTSSAGASGNVSTTPAVSGPMCAPVAASTTDISQAKRISQGEKVLLTNRVSSDKANGTVALQAQAWDKAIAEFTNAKDADRNDPESRIYYNNARACKQGKPITIAVVAPVTPAPEIAQEILRGVAQYQEEYNQNPANSQELMEVVIVDAVNSGMIPGLAKVLVDAQQVSGVVGHGVDATTQVALDIYEQGGLPALTPLTTEVTDSQRQGPSTIKLVPPGSTQTLSEYVNGVGQSLAEYVSKTLPRERTVVFYNSDNAYGQKIKDAYEAANASRNGTVFAQGIDVAKPGFNPAAALADAQAGGSKIILLALSGERMPEAIAIGQANQALGTPMLMLGADELYNSRVLLQGEAAMDGLVLAVPWSADSDKPFVVGSDPGWKGRISWRTSIAYDATKGLMSALKNGASRQAALTSLQGGEAIFGAATASDTLDRLPLVRVVKSDGQAPLGIPEGAKYRFDPLFQSSP